MFSVLRDAQGQRYQPISGRGNQVTYQAQPNGPTVTTHSYRQHSGDALTLALAPPSSDRYPTYLASGSRSEPAPAARRAHEHSTDTRASADRPRALK
jgi:hypothetical protein